MNALKEKKNEEREQELEVEQVISGSQEFEILMPPFHIWDKLKIGFKYMGPHEIHSEENMAL